MKRIFLAVLALMLFEGVFLVQATPAWAATKIMPGAIIPARASDTSCGGGRPPPPVLSLVSFARLPRRGVRAYVVRGKKASGLTRFGGRSPRSAARRFSEASIAIRKRVSAVALPT
jgi:hypothetical protein